MPGEAAQMIQCKPGDPAIISIIETIYSPASVRQIRQDEIPVRMLNPTNVSAAFPPLSNISQNNKPCTDNERPPKKLLCKPFFRKYFAAKECCKENGCAFYR